MCVDESLSFPVRLRPRVVDLEHQILAEEACPAQTKILSATLSVEMLLALAKVNVAVSRSDLTRNQNDSLASINGRTDSKAAQ